MMSQAQACVEISIDPDPIQSKWENLLHIATKNQLDTN